MRKLEDRTSFYAESHRLDKAATLAEFIKKHYGATHHVIEHLPTQSYEWWGSTAREAKVNPPSPACVEAVIGILSAERGPRFVHPEDVLEGLPTP